MTSPTSIPVTGDATSLPMDGIGASPQPTKQLGGFDIPKSVPVPPTQAGAPVTTVKPTTDTVSVNLGSGAVVASSKPVEIPKVQWSQPVTAVQAKGPAAQTGGEKAVVTYVGDGDSVSLNRKDGSTLNCRIDSIDAPEIAKPKYGKPGQAFGEEAKQTLQNMILNQEVTVKISKPATADKNYGRTLCQIEIQGQNIDKTMLREGAAWLYRRFNSDPTLSAIENDARANKRGLWANPNAINPEAFRRLQQFGNRPDQ